MRKGYRDLLSEWGYSGPHRPSSKIIDPIEAAGDDVLILELVKRGYAVAKMPPEKLAEAAK
jgi:hypothetical protein